MLNFENLSFIFILGRKERNLHRWTKCTEYKLEDFDPVALIWNDPVWMSLISSNGQLQSNIIHREYIRSNQNPIKISLSKSKLTARYHWSCMVEKKNNYQHTHVRNKYSQLSFTWNYLSMCVRVCSDNMRLLTRIYFCCYCSDCCAGRWRWREWIVLVL